MKYKTAQEDFWAGDFGDEYIDRNKSEWLLASNINFFSKALSRTSELKNAIELGANIGMNCRALKKILPNIELSGVEINKTAAQKLENVIGKENVLQSSIFDLKTDQLFDLTFTKGVLIHLNPEKLSEAYEKLYNLSKKYILICEYYSPTPVSIPYRGVEDRLFKRDFCAEIIDMYSDLNLIDYGFSYRNDAKFPQDDITWFLLEK